ncbi:MAG: MFS transporter [Ilumatobacteraceae bacterium]
MLIRATRAVSLVFILCGLGIASLLSRVPQIRDELELRPGPLGRLLLMIAIGSLVSLPLSGLMVHRLGVRRTVVIFSVLCQVGLAIAAVGVLVDVWVVGAGFLLIGFGNGFWDVAQNVEAAAVEQQLGRSIMSRFHAGFSIGTVAGALGGAAMNALDVPVTAHLLVVAVIVGAGVPLATRGFLPAEESPADEAHGDAAPRHPLAAWKERRTLLIGLFVLTMAFTEGTGNDWLGVATIDGYGSSDVVGSMAYVLFVAAMTTGRWFGPSALDRHGRVRVLRVSAAMSMAGVLVVIFGPSLVTAMVGIVLWGLGAALGFPTGMSAAADDPVLAAGRVSVVATIGYTAFLAGPALIGLIGDHVGVLKALTVTAGLLAVGLMAAGATAPLPVSPREPAHDA